METDTWNDAFAAYDIPLPQTSSSNNQGETNNQPVETSTPSVDNTPQSDTTSKGSPTTADSSSDMAVPEAPEVVLSSELLKTQIDDPKVAELLKMKKAAAEKTPPNGKSAQGGGSQKDFAKLELTPQESDPDDDLEKEQATAF